MTQKNTILLVDDTDVLLNFYKVKLSMKLADENINILIAENGAKACALLADLSPDELLCIITDYEMPEMDGRDFCAHARCTFTETKIFLHTNTYAGDIEELKQQMVRLKIEILSKETSLDDNIIPWIKTKVKQAHSSTNL